MLTHVPHTFRRYLHNLRLQREFTSGLRDVAVRAVALYAAQGMIVYSEGSKVKVRGTAEVACARVGGMVSRKGSPHSARV